MPSAQESNTTKTIYKSISKLIRDKRFMAWKNKEKIKPGDIVIINNSFVRRGKVDKTKKSIQYIGIELDNNNDLNKIWVIRGNGAKPQIKNFKRIKFSETQNLDKRELNEEVENQFVYFGQLVYILIANINNYVTTNLTLKNGIINKLEYNPSFESLKVDNGILKIKDTSDIQEIWNFLESHFQGNPNFQKRKQDIKTELGINLDTLEKKLIAQIKLPSKKSDLVNPNNLIDSLVSSLNSNVKTYRDALQRWDDSNRQDNYALNEILRISYNFSTEVIPFVLLINSICDLKPIVLWGALHQHFDLSEQFRNLPWHRSQNKPVLTNYIETISNARNSRFHHLFPFKSKIIIDLPDDSIQNPSLTIFSSHSNKKENILSYKDKKMVDLLTEFTRADEHKITFDFWRKNAEVMESAIQLFKGTSNILKTIFLENLENKKEVA